MLTLLIISTLYGFRTPVLDKVDVRCYEKPYAKVWVYFTDKGIPVEKYAAALKTVSPSLSRAALKRRLTRGGVIDYADLPVNRDYIADIEGRGGLLVRQSKWLNAASFWVRREDLPDIAKSGTVYKITPVAGFGPSEALETATAAEDTLVYGMSYHQLKMFNIDKLHEKTVFGSGVIVGVMDTGLKRKHNALNAVKVIAQYDFFSGDRIYARGTPGLGEAAVTNAYGVYGDVEFHKSAGGRLYLFLSGDTVYNNQPVRDLLFTYSDDGGDTWLPDPRKLTQNFNNWVNEVTVCGRDTMFIFYDENYGINYRVFTNDTVLIAPIQPLTGQLYREPTAVQVDDTVYVFYQSKNKLYLRKGNYGGGFGIETTVDSFPFGTDVKYPKAVSGFQKVGVFYHTLFGDSLFFLRDSVPVDNFTRTFLFIGKDAEAMTAGDTIFLIWKDLSLSPLTRVGFAKSSDFGVTFSTPVFLSENVAALGKISIARDASTATVAWETGGRIYSKTSADGGDNFGSVDSLGLEFTYLPTLAGTAGGILKFYVTRGDTVTDDLTNQPNHGTEMLGLIGGYSENLYRGVAPGVQFLVAKTEIRDSVYEYPIEEDMWVSGLEWLESRGADIVNSSLGYLKWYRQDEYDGKTSPASIAGYEAYRRGVIVVTAAGNVASHQLVAPGDAEGVITVGGIDTLFQRWEYSGYGPTADGRLKPEVVSLAKATVVVEPDSSGSYLLSTGTSGATAMVSGMCALLLETHPNWSPDSVRRALFTTAHYASSPTDSLGYGWPDVFAAANLSPWWRQDTLPGNAFLTPYPNPFPAGSEARIYLPFKLSASCYVTFRVYSIAGRLLWNEERGEQLLPGRYTAENPLALNRAFSWDGRDQAGNLVGSGLYYCALITTSGQSAIAKIAVVR